MRILERARYRTPRRTATPGPLAALRWVRQAHRQIGPQLRNGVGPEGVVVLDAPTAPKWCEPLIKQALRSAGVPCLERSLLLQAWHLAHRRPLDVIVAVAPPAGGFMAHAWLENEAAPSGGPGFTELARLAPSGNGRVTWRPR